jgi:hypothetical protein
MTHFRFVINNAQATINGTMQRWPCSLSEEGRQQLQPCTVGSSEAVTMVEWDSRFCIGVAHNGPPQVTQKVDPWFDGACALAA